MAYGNKIRTSIHGRRLGLEGQSTSVSGGSQGENEYLVGPQALRLGVTTAETTDANLQPHGISKLQSSSVGSSQVYTLDPPVPGVDKVIFGSTDAVSYVKTANSETMASSEGSSATVIAFPVGGGALRLSGYTTAQWVIAQDITSYTVSTST